MNLERDTAPTGFYDTLPRLSSRRRKTRRSTIGTLKPGLLKAVGYSVTATATRRHKAVKRAVAKYGRSSTIKKLNAVAVYTRRTSPAKSKRFKADMKFAQRMKGGNPMEALKSLVSKEMSEVEDTLIAEPSVDAKAKARALGIPEDKLATLESLYGALKDTTSGLKK
jgi:hypothetical protein